MTKNEILKETRGLCRAQGCVLRTHTNFYVEGRPAYYIALRCSDKVIMSHMTLSTAHDRSLDDSIRQALALN